MAAVLAALPAMVRVSGTPWRVKHLFELGALSDGPAVHRGMIDPDATSTHQFFDMTVAQWIRHRPPHAREDHVLWKVGTLEAYGHPSFPSLIALEHRGKA